jgi:hypothetical protein
MNDIIQELCEEFPEIEERSIRKICHDGLMGILKFARLKEELLIKMEKNEETKFFVPLTPKRQDELINRNKLRRYKAAKKKENGKTSE